MNDLLARLIAAGTPAHLVAEVAMELGRAQGERDALERRRATDRERQRESREAKKVAEGNECHVTSRDVTVVTDEPLPSPSPSFPPDPQTNPTPAHPVNNTPRARKADPFACPEGVDPVDWDGLKANRKAKRAPLSEGAHRQIINKLDRWALDGWPPGPIVACAAERGWTTVFETDEMKGTPHGQQRNLDRQGSANRHPRRDGFLSACFEAGEGQAAHLHAGNG